MIDDENDLHLIPVRAPAAHCLFFMLSHSFSFSPSSLQWHHHHHHCCW